MAKRVGIAMRIVYYLANVWWYKPTLGDVMIALGLPKGTAAGERLRDARKMGFDIQHKIVADKWNRRLRHVYFMPPEERRRVRNLPGYKARYGA